MRNTLKVLVGSVLVVLLVGGSFLGGVIYRDTGGAVPSLQPTETVQTTELGRLVSQVRAIIKTSALVPSADSSITAGAIDGMLSSLEDTYAVYYDPKAFTDLKEEQTGEFYGIGVSIGLDASGTPYAARVFAGSPAAKSGLKDGDKFPAVNGVKRAKWDLDQFVKMVRGPKGTTVTLTVVRKGSKPFDVKITRDKISVPNTMTKVYGKVGYIRLMTFNERSAQDVADAVRALGKKGAKGYVLDLRENPGGLLTSAIDVASLFVKDGVIVRVDERDKAEEVDYATGDQVTSAPLVVLVDGLSASASEIVTGALKDHKRATIVGEKTYGKGSVQSVLPIRNGGAVKLTIAHYLTPNKTVINGVGVHPDVTVKMDPMLQRSDKTDTQLQRALEVLRSKL